MDAAGGLGVSLDDLRHPDGTFRILALDHRDSLRAFLSPEHPDAISPADLTDIKLDLAGAVLPEASGVMLEPEYSIPQLIDAGVVPAGVGFTAALEAQGYLADPGAGPTRLLDGWSPAAAVAAGAAAAKLLVPYHPDHHLAGEQERVAAEVLAECRSVGIALVLEPLFFGLATPSERPGVVVRTVERFARLGPDLLKLPFPVDTAHEPDPATWAYWCDAVSERAPMPWTLLSGGGTFESFAAQVHTAHRHGCSGFMVGRALWGEAARAERSLRRSVIDAVVMPRWRRLVSITEGKVQR